MSIKALYPSTFPITQVDFSNKSFLPPEVEFSRGSSATYIGSDGLIKTALPGEPRFTHDPVSGEGLGLLVEEARTNFFSNSSILSNITVFNGTPGTASVLLPMTGTVETVRTLSTNITQANAYGDITVPTSGIYYFSFWIRNVTGVPITIVYGCVPGNSNNRLYPINLPNDNWVKVGGIIQTNSPYQPTSLRNIVFCDSRYTNLGATDPSITPISIQVWGGQVEAGSFPTSYIPTSGSTVTRAADTFSIPVQNLKSSRIVFAPSSSTHSLTSPTLTFSDSSSPTPPYSLELSAPSLIPTLVTKYNFIPQSYLSIPSYPPTTPPPSPYSVAFNYDATTGEMALATSAGEDSDAAVVSLPPKYNIPAPTGYNLDVVTVAGSGILREFYTWEETLSPNQLASVGQEYRAIGKNTYESSGLQPDLYELGGARPTLDLDFASRGDLKNAVNGEELITYSRGSAGTYYDSDGVLRTAIADEPRFDHDPVTGESLGLLVEEQRTNEIYNSDVKTYQTGQPFTTVGNIWQSCSNPNQGIITNITTTTTEEGPDGLFGVTKIAPNAGINYDFINFTVSDGFQIGFTFTGNNKAVTGFFKPSGCDVLNVRWGDYSTSRAVYTFDTSTLSATGSDASITSVANGWFKFTITNRTTQSLTFGCSKSNGDPNNGTDGVLLWGVQVEDNASFPTSYIPTAGGQGTRNADTVSITGTNFSSWYNGSAFSTYVNFKYTSEAFYGGNTASAQKGTPFRLYGSGSGAYNQFLITREGNGTSSAYLRGYIYDQQAQNTHPNYSFLAVGNTSGTSALGSGPYKACLSADSQGGSFSYFGNIATGVFAVPTSDFEYNTLLLGSNYPPPDQQGSLTISRLTYWPLRLPDTSLQAITNPAIETWDIVFDSSLSANGTCAIITNSTCQYIVDWGDGTPTQTISASGTFTVTHRYVVPKKYSVKIDVVSGAFRPYYNNSSYADKLVEIGPSPDGWTNTSTSGFGVSLDYAFYGGINLTSVSLYLDVSGITNFSNAWRGCTSLTSFPLLDTSSGTNFTFTWQNCSSLTSFPLLDTSSGTSFSNTWRDCTGLTSFPLLDTSSGTSFSNTWRDCTGLTSFPLLDTSSGTNFTIAWFNCTSLTSFPLLDTSSGTNFFYAWYGCTSLTSFPLLDTSSGTNFSYSWQNCTSLTSFPLLDTSSGTNFTFTWQNCSSLTSFPANMFNTTGTLISTAFSNAFTNCALTAQSIENILVSLDTNGQSNITLGINGGTNAAKSTWSTAANTAYDNLIAKGWTIAYNA